MLYFGLVFILLVISLEYSMILLIFIFLLSFLHNFPLQEKLQVILIAFWFFALGQQKKNHKKIPWAYLSPLMASTIERNCRSGLEQSLINLTTAYHHFTCKFHVLQTMERLCPVLSAEGVISKGQDVYTKKQHRSSCMTLMASNRFPFPAPRQSHVFRTMLDDYLVQA